MITVKSFFEKGSRWVERGGATPGKGRHAYAWEMTKMHPRLWKKEWGREGRTIDGWTHPESFSGGTIPNA